MYRALCAAGAADGGGMVEMEGRQWTIVASVRISAYQLCGISGCVSDVSDRISTRCIRCVSVCITHSEVSEVYRVVSAVQPGWPLGGCIKGRQLIQESVVSRCITMYLGSRT